MKSALSFLMINHCLLDPTGNQFLFEAVYGARDAGISSLLAPPRKSPEWEGLAGLEKGGMPAVDLGEEETPPLSVSPYLNRPGRRAANSLDKARLRGILKRQLGGKTPQGRGLGDTLFGLYAEWRELPFRDGVWKAGLFGALHLCGRSDSDRALGLRILDNLSASRDERGKAETGLSEREEDQLRSCLITAHRAEGCETLRSGFVNTLFMRLLEWAERLGPLPCGALDWIRRFDGTLWLALSRAREFEPDAGACGAWAHLAAEKAAGKPIDRETIEPAIIALEREMAKDGWLPIEMSKSEISENISSWLNRTD